MGGLNERDLHELTSQRYDLAIIGGGIYGAMLALEATRHGLRPVLLERGDFGAATSGNSLRIIHGGLRYLQRLDLSRHRASVRERAWWCETFPDYVTPLPCLLPLYNAGLERPLVLRAALAVDRLLGGGVGRPGQLLRGRVLSAVATTALCTEVDPRGLVGGATWCDAMAVDAPLLLLEVLRWACAQGARVLNYVEVVGCSTEQGRVSGLRIRDRVGGGEWAVEAPIAINAAGPWVERVASACGAAAQGLFTPTLAFNLLIDRTTNWSCALAVSPRVERRNGKPVKAGQTYFLVPFKGVLLAGTGHAIWNGGPDSPRPSADQIDAFLQDLNLALPALGVHRRQVARVFAGLFPAARAGSVALSRRPRIVDHGAAGGPLGLFTVVGVKWTTARAVAQRAIQRAFPAARRQLVFSRPTTPPRTPGHPFAWMPEGGHQCTDELAQVTSGTGVVHLDDLLLRRSTLGDNPRRALSIAADACRLLRFGAEVAEHEVAALAGHLDTGLERRGR